MALPKIDLESSNSQSFAPQVIHISREIRQSEKVNDAYREALDAHGPVIIVPRHGRNEYIIDHRYAHEVLTDVEHYTFDKAAFEMLHFGFIALFDDGKFVRDIDGLIESNVQSRMSAIIDQIFPVFQEYFDRLTDELPSPTEDKTPVEFDDIFSRMQKAISHAMVFMIFGPTHSVAADHVTAVAVAMARLTGLHENTHEWTWFPSSWVFWTGVSGVLFTIIPRFFLTIAPMVWKTRHEHLADGLAARRGEYVPLLDMLLVDHYHGKTGLAALGGFIWTVILCVGMIFASIHQTVVAGFWILILLAEKQDEYLPAIRAQWDEITNGDEPLTVNQLSKMTLLDSFIREVLRKKGDTFGPIRKTTQPVRVGPYMLPKGALCLVHVARAHQHPDNYGSRGRIFDGFRWAKEQQPAAKGTPEFLSFGLGRWSCPGRQLAVHEIKIMLYLFFGRVDVRVKEGSFRVRDYINTTSVPPEASLLVRRRE